MLCRWWRESEGCLFSSLSISRTRGLLEVDDKITNHLLLIYTLLYSFAIYITPAGKCLIHKWVNLIPNNKQSPKCLLLCYVIWQQSVYLLSQRLWVRYCQECGLACIRLVHFARCLCYSILVDSTHLMQINVEAVFCFHVGLSSVHI